jgi:hypothetical protein
MRVPIWTPSIHISSPDGIIIALNWITNPNTGAVVGLFHHHPVEEMAGGVWPNCAGGCYITWGDFPGREPSHLLAGGGPDDPEGLTITPSITHCAPGTRDPSPHHGCRGLITDGRWVVTD